MTSSVVTCGRPRDCKWCMHAYWGLLHIVIYGRDKGYIIDDIAGSECVQENIYPQIAQYDPQFYFGIGHGNTDVYTDNRGHDIWNLFDFKPTNLKDRVIYMWSCLTAKTLGPAIINQYGGKTYIGFDISWTWYDESETDDTPHPDPYDDTVARGYFEAGNELIKALFDGDTVQEAVEKSKNKYDEWIGYWTYGEGSSNHLAAQYIAALVMDKNGLKVYGNNNIRLDRGCQEYDGEDICLANDCYWYNRSCHNMPPTCEELYDPDECYANDCYWYHGSCHDEPPPPDSIITFNVEADMPKMDAISFEITNTMIRRIDIINASIQYRNNGYPSNKAYCSIYVLETDTEIYFWNGYINNNEEKTEDVNGSPLGLKHPWGDYTLRMEVGYLIGENRQAQSVLDKQVFILQ